MNLEDGAFYVQAARVVWSLAQDDPDGARLELAQMDDDQIRELRKVAARLERLCIDERAAA